MANILDKDNNSIVLSKGFIGASQTQGNAYAPHVDVAYGPFDTSVNALLSFKNLFGNISNTPVGLVFGIRHTDGSIDEYRIEKPIESNYNDHTIGVQLWNDLFNNKFIQEYCVRKSMIFQGTQAAYDSLSPEDRSKYYLAFIEEE